MYVLGLSFDYHDSAAALISDRGVIAAAQEERFSRVKNDKSFPTQAIQFCLEQAGIVESDLSQVVFHESPLLKFDRILTSSLKNGVSGLAYLHETTLSWISQNKFFALRRISQELGVSRNKITHVQHHQSHAASAYYGSNFDQATVVTIDGVGEYETVTISKGVGSRLEKLESIRLPHSLGLLYSAFTSYLGFRVNSGEYKVMGMSAFGEPSYLEEMETFVELREDGSFRINEKYFNFLTPTELPYTDEFVNFFGPARVPESDFPLDKLDRDSQDAHMKRCRHYADIAASIQLKTEQIILHIVRAAMKKTGIEKLCLAGGVALNSLANGRLQRELRVPIYIHPAAGDAGCALGAALHWYHHHRRVERIPSLVNPYLGKAYPDAEIETALRTSPFRKYLKSASEDEMLEECVKRLVAGRVIGWVQGRFEWGPRALGARSIIANPTLVTMKDVVNQKIKFREPFRPFAPSAIEERASDFFDLPERFSAQDPEHFMLSVCKVKGHIRDKLPAITHIDGSARVQLVRRDTNPIYHKLITSFGEKTGVPVILNTSFNLRGEPIVSSPKDALRTFAWCHMDSLVVGNYIIDKES